MPLFHYVYIYSILLLFMVFSVNGLFMTTHHPFFFCLHLLRLHVCNVTLRMHIYIYTLLQLLALSELETTVKWKTTDGTMRNCLTAWSQPTSFHCLLRRLPVCFFYAFTWFAELSDGKTILVILHHCYLLSNQLLCVWHSSGVSSEVCTL